MAINNSRSMNEDLRKGALDGSYKSLTPGRGGDVEEAAVKKRMAVLEQNTYPTMHGFTDRNPLAELAEPYLH